MDFERHRNLNITSMETQNPNEAAARAQKTVNAIIREDLAEVESSARLKEYESKTTEDISMITKDLEEARKKANEAEHKAVVNFYL
jgi:hypothetical protein